MEKNEKEMINKNCENCKKSSGCIIRFRIGNLTSDITFDPIVSMLEFFGNVENIVDLSMKIGELIAERCKRWEE